MVFSRAVGGAAALAGSRLGRRAGPSGASRPLPWVSSVLYGAVLVAGLYYDIASLGDASGRPVRMAGFVLGLALLFALEIIERHRYVPRTPPGPAVVLLVARVSLFLAVAALDGSGLSRALFVLVPFTAYFAFGRATALALAASCVGLIVGYYALRVPRWYTDQEYVSDVLMFFIGLVLAVSMAALAVGEQEARVRLERALRALEDSHAQLTTYAAQVAELSAATERNQLARDIHDSLGHHLTAIGVQLEKASAFRDRDPTSAEQALADAQRSARFALADVRQSVRALHEAVPFSLPSALADLVRRVDGGQVSVTLDVVGEAHGYDTATLTALYRAAQEGLTNAQRHANAGHAWVSVTFDERGARLVVADDGRGFLPSPPERTAVDGRDRFGLLGMRERVQLVGGHVDVDSSPGAGTRVTVTIPPASSVRDAEPGTTA